MRRNDGIYELLQDSALNYPDRAFIQHLGRVWTYNEVLCITRHVSRVLVEHGVEKGDRVILFCDNSIQYVAAFFGILKSGAVVVPVNPVKTIESIAYIVEKCTSVLILTCDKTAARLGKFGQRINALRLNIVNLDRLDIFRTPDLDGGRSDLPDHALDANDVAEILFTSGTTANPKGVTLTYGNLLANTEAIVQYLALTYRDSILMTLPFAYSYGNSILLTHARTGATIVIDDSAAFPYKVLEGIKKHKVTGFSTVGSYANLLLKYVRNLETDDKFFEALRYMTFAGEATSTDDLCYLRKYFPHIKVYVMYGQTEAGARLSYLDPDMLAGKLGSVGKGLCNVTLRVVDEAGMDIKAGEVGEIIACGPNIMKGYWDDSAATDEVLKNGWLYTGDIASVDEDGYIYIKGRKSDMIKHMGHRISPVEIETVINRCSYIKECAVIEHSLGRTTVIKAYIVPTGECPMDTVKSFANAKLPTYMRPQVFEVVYQLPKTDSGKIKRSSLRGL